MLGLDANDLGTVLTGIGLALIALLGGKTTREMASRKQQPPQGTVELAGAVISDKAVERMVKSLDEFSSAANALKSAIDRDVAAKKAMTEALVSNSRALDRNNDVADEVNDGMKDTARIMSDLKTEIIRSQTYDRTIPPGRG